MAKTSAQDNRKLEKKIRNAKIFMTRVVKFVIKAVKLGKTTKHDEHSSNTHIIEELEFGDFKLSYHHGMTVMGGEKVIVLYKTIKVVEIYSQEDLEILDKCEIWTFEHTGPWVRRIGFFIRDERKIVALLKPKETSATRTLRKNEETALKRAKLQKEAARIRLM